MDQHIKILSVLFIIFGIIGILAAILVFVIGAGTAATIASQGGSDQDRAAGMLATGGCMTAVAAVVGILAIPNLIAGWGLMKRKSWARILTIIMACLSLPSFPLGTAIGVYALWVMFNEETKRLLVA
jgi:hypothetical protein